MERDVLRNLGEVSVKVVEVRSRGCTSGVGEGLRGVRAGRVDHPQGPAIAGPS